MKYLNTYKIFEVHYKDRLSKGFQDFRKKWNKFKTNDNYYVQFTNYKDNNIDKSSYTSPDHSDPKGTYAYPLKYVINYPMDVWYGIDAKYLRVLESKATNTLYINSIKDKEDCTWFLSKCFDGNLRDMEEMVYRARKSHKHRLQGSKTWAKTFFQCIQVDYTEYKEDKDDYPLRSAEEQSKILIKGGWDSVLDEARSINTAVINDREPNQIIFLKPKFNVVDVYHLKKEENLNSYLAHTSIGDAIGRKWASLILKQLDGDKIKEKGSDNYSGSTFYSKEGREIILNFEQDTSYRDNLKLGQKRHKAHKLHDDYKVKITIKTEYGDIIDRVYEDSRLEDTLRSIKNEWDEIKKGDIKENWEKRSLESKEREEKKARDDFYKKKKEEERKKRLSRLDNFKKSVYGFSEKYNLPFNINDTEKLLAYIEHFEGLCNRLPFYLKEERLDEIIDKEIKDLKESFDEEDPWLLNMYYGGKSEEDYNNAISFLEIIRNIFKDDVIKNSKTLHHAFYG